MRTLSLLFHLFSFPEAITCSQYLLLHEMIIFLLPPTAAADWFVNVIKVLHPRKESMRTLTVSLLLFVSSSLAVLVTGTGQKRENGTGSDRDSPEKRRTQDQGLPRTSLSIAVGTRAGCKAVPVVLFPKRINQAFPSPTV